MTRASPLLVRFPFSFPFLFLIFCFLFSVLYSSGASASIPTAFVTDGSPAARMIEQRVLLDRRLERASWQEARLIWVVGATPDPLQWRRLLGRVRVGAGLVFVPGAKLPDLSPLGLGRGVAISSRVTLIPSEAPRADRMITREVVWASAPQVARRWRLGRAAAFSVLVTEQRKQAGSLQPVVLTGQMGSGRVALVTLQLTDPSNRELILWPYFNYLLHVLSSRASGTTPNTFASWPASPVPGHRTLWTLLTVLAVLWLLTLGLFIRARRYSKAHPEILEQFFVGAAQGPQKKPGSDAWRAVGFTRPLAGFLTLTGTMFLIFAPWYYLTNVIIPNEVQPFPQAKGMWNFAWEALQMAWFLFDAGTFVAFVKYFAEYRIKDPAEAVRSAQFFVWWQILTGLFQVTMAGIVAVVFLPHTRYGYSSNFVILVALAQYPGFFAVVTFFFQAYQRFDYNIALDLLADWVLRFALQIPCVLLMRQWGIDHPEYGEAFGAAVGIGIGYYLSALLTFLVGVLLYRRLGLRLLPLFLAHFDGDTARRMLLYGVKVLGGQWFYRSAKTAERVVISVLLFNYTEWLGIESQIHYNLMFLFPVAYRFFETAMAALSESHGNGKPRLTQYYVTRFLQVGSLYTAIGLSILWALGPTFIRHAMDPQWARAADYLVLAAIIGAFYAPAWISDMLQKGAGHPGLFAVILAIEQVLRIGLFLLLIPRWQFFGFYLAMLITIALKVVGAWIVNHRRIIALRIFYWQMFVAPALAGLFNFLLLRLLAGALGWTGRVEVMVLFFGGALLSFFVCFFFNGLAGGFDRALAGELQQASGMTGLLRPLTRLFYWSARAGWTLSPLHDRFPVTLHDEAMEEARELEAGARNAERGARNKEQGTRDKEPGTGIEGC